MSTNSSSPMLTIGIPVFNGQNTIIQTLESCTKLSVKFVRIIISDNASTDNTFEIAQSFATRFDNISIFRHHQNLGPGNNFQYLLDNCNTDFFMWLAADDVISDGFNIDEIIHLFQRYPNSIAVSPLSFVGDVGFEIPDRGNRSLCYNSFLNTILYLFLPGVNSRFYSIYRTRKLRLLYSSVFGVDRGNYLASDVVFSAAVLREGKWPMASSFVLKRKPGISSDGWRLRKIYAKGLFDTLFPSVKFVRQIVGMVPPLEKLPVLLIASLLYFRFFIGPLKHRLNKNARR